MELTPDLARRTVALRASLTPGAVFCLLALYARLADGESPSVGLLARDLDADPPNVRRWLADLVSYGLVGRSTESGPRGSAIYVLGPGVARHLDPGVDGHLDTALSGVHRPGVDKLSTPGPQTPGASRHPVSTDPVSVPRARDLRSPQRGSFSSSKKKKNPHGVSEGEPRDPVSVDTGSVYETTDRREGHPVPHDTGSGRTGLVCPFPNGPPPLSTPLTDWDHAVGRGRYPAHYEFDDAGFLIGRRDPSVARATQSAAQEA